MISVLLEDSWDAGDIVQYCQQHRMGCRVMSPADLLALHTAEFIKCVPFCSTDIVRHHLIASGRGMVVPDTYEDVYKLHFHRDIALIPFSDVKPGSFVKPAANDKSFDGQVFYNNESFLGPAPDAQTLVYNCEAMKVISEYRLLIGGRRLYGKGFVSGVRMDDGLLPSSMIGDLVALTTSFRCVDIGFVKLATGTLRWVVVEVNPPFSLDDHTISLNDYMAFCIDAWLEMSSESSEDVEKP